MDYSLVAVSHVFMFNFSWGNDPICESILQLDWNHHMNSPCDDISRESIKPLSIKSNSTFPFWSYLAIRMLTKEGCGEAVSLGTSWGQQIFKYTTDLKDEEEWWAQLLLYHRVVLSCSVTVLWTIFRDHFIPGGLGYIGKEILPSYI